MRDSAERDAVESDMLSILACAVVAATATRLARRGHVSAAETSVFEMVNGLPESFTPILYAVMQGGQFLAIPGSAGSAALAGHPGAAKKLALAGVSAWTLARVVKKATGRGRPNAHLTGVTIRGKQWSGLGFPSGHAAVAASLAAALSPDAGRPAQIGLWSLAALIALTRLYVGAHLPLDAVGGFALGIAAGRSAVLVVDALGSDLSATATGM